MWVIFEGLDKSGKGTLERAFLKATNYRHIVIDRGPVGYLTFDEIFNRSNLDRKRDFICTAIDVAFSKEHLVVYCTVDKDVAIKRIKDNNETCPYDYEKAQKAYEENIRRYYGDRNVVIVNTTSASVEICVNLIIDKLIEVLTRI